MLLPLFYSSQDNSSRWHPGWPFEEAEGIIENTDSGTMIRHAGLILAAQKVEHYEIGTYGTLKVFAENMDKDDVADSLSQTLENEKQQMLPPLSVP